MQRKYQLVRTLLTHCDLLIPYGVLGAIGSSDASVPFQHQAITRTNDDLSIWPLGTAFAVKFKVKDWENVFKNTV